MKTRLTLTLIKRAALLVLFATLDPPLSTFAQGTVFTYQGRVTDNGTNFSGVGQFKFALVTSTNTSRPATATANLTGPFVTSYTIVDPGAGYATAPAVTITGGGGSAATATASVSGGVVTNITANTTGSGYASAPTVTIAPPPPNISYTTYWSNDGTSVAGNEPSTAANVPVSGGLFTVVLGDSTLANMMAITTGFFTQPNLQLRIWFNDGVNGFAALSPAQSLTPAPYASFAYMASGLPGMVVQSNTNGGPNVIGGSQNNYVSSGMVGATIGGGGATNFFGYSYTNSVTGNFGTVSGGQQNTASFNATVAGGSFNTASGPNASVGGGLDNMSSGYLATVAGGKGNLASGQYSFIGGGDQNTDAAYDGCIAGGGQNVIGVDAAWSAIGGGVNNSIETNIQASTIAGGLRNSILAGPSTVSACFIGGGRYNVIRGSDGTISGGLGNQIGVNSVYATIGGGSGNSAQGSDATIGGGEQNNASGFAATVSGGYLNAAVGNYSFAAGRQAKANHQGAFVWADGTAADFASLRTDQFRVRANGGVRLDVNSNGWVEVFAKTVGVPPFTIPKFIDTSTGAILTPGGAWTDSSDRNVKENFQPVDAQRILDQVSALPVTRWNYKVEGSAVQHIGPVAQDFQSPLASARTTNTSRRSMPTAWRWWPSRG